MRRTAITVVTVLAILVIGAAPASAHTVAGVSSSNYVTTLESVSPRVEGLELRIVEAGSRLELRNTTDSEALVLGYNDEPYLRVGPEGVFENTRSPATYLNADRQGGSVPSDADAEADPVWRKVSGGNVARWHDHRIHWMGEQPPVPVRRDPGERHVIHEEWKVTVQHAGRAVTATGTMVWEPGPSPIPWIAAIVVLAVAGFALSFVRRWGPAIGTGVLVLVAVDVVHSVGIAWTTAGSTGTRLGMLVGGSFFNILLWVVGLVAVRPLFRDSDIGMLPAAIASLFLALFGGVLDIGALGKTTVPFAWSATLARALIAVTVGLGVGLAVGTVWRLHRTGALLPRVEPEPPEPEPESAAVA